ncbi:hypothetical protein AX14_011150 [Amanita brunnescens Koide BX004]|jgi:hypothetical protein|nr:hypothetical protein AX14_011150 [Amanita brunnescens Koide BX004]
MSQSAGGTFVGGDRDFTGTFKPAEENLTVVIKGKFNKSVPSFNCPTASITYTILDNFSGTYNIALINPISYLGKDSVNITFEYDGVTLQLTGKLNQNIPDKLTIGGSGTWFIG